MAAGTIFNSSSLPSGRRITNSDPRVSSLTSVSQIASDRLITSDRLRASVASCKRSNRLFVSALPSRFSRTLFPSLAGRGMVSPTRLDTEPRDDHQAGGGQHGTHRFAVGVHPTVDDPEGQP